MTPRLKEKYKSEIVPQLEKELNIANINQVPKVTKIVDTIVDALEDSMQDEI